MFQFVHSSDWHLPTPLPAGGEGASQLKQLLGRISWRYARHRKHRRDVFEAALRAWERLRADRHCVTGDLVNFAHSAEFAAASSELRRASQVSPVSLVPGNHDALVGRGSAEQVRHWQSWLAGEESAAAWPSIRVHGPAVFVGLSSAIPTGPFLAQGFVAAAQLNALEQVLARFGKSGHFRVVMVHHPIHVGAAPWRRGLRNASALRDVLSRAGAELVLHGHLHRRTRGSVESGSGPIPVFGAGSSSLAGVNAHGARAHFHRFELSEALNGRWSLGVTDYYYDADKREFCPQPTVPAASFLNAPSGVSR